MNTRILLVSILGFTALAHATTSYYIGSTGNTNYNNAITMDSLMPVSGPAFSATYLVTGNHEYSDPTSMFNFFTFSNNGGTPGSADTFSVNSSHLIAQNQDFLEITLPANVFAVGLNMIGASGTAIMCGSIGSYDGSCTNQFTASSGNTQFFGVVSDTAISSVWVYATFGAPDVASYSYATGAATPESNAMALLGTGLFSIALLKFRRKQRGLRNQQAAATTQDPANPQSEARS